MCTNYEENVVELVWLFCITIFMITKNTKSAFLRERKRNLTQYNLEEMKILNQMLLALFIVADFALLLFFTNNTFPWTALLGSGIGLSIIVLCWTGKKHTFFIASILVFTTLFSIVYNWQSIVH